MDNCKRLAVAFGCVVKEERQSLGYSQETLAQMADLHRTYASLVERGRTMVTICTAHKLAAALDIPLSELMKRVEQKASSE